MLLFVRSTTPTGHTVLYSLFTVYCSLFSILYSLFTVLFSPPLHSFREKFK